MDWPDDRSREIHKNMQGLNKTDWHWWQKPVVTLMLAEVPLKNTPSWRQNLPSCPFYTYICPLYTLNIRALNYFNIQNFLNKLELMCRKSNPQLSVILVKTFTPPVKKKMFCVRISLRLRCQTTTLFHEAFSTCMPFLIICKIYQNLRSLEKVVHCHAFLQFSLDTVVITTTYSEELFTIRFQIPLVTG